MADFSQGSQSLLFSIPFKFHLATLTPASLGHQHLTGLRPQQTPMLCPFQELSTQDFNTFMIP